ncbi:J domain-containing protein [Enterocloster citroniae]|uniref:J domain-containing protein n=1 Tax=[Clostridium] citroniae WAL-17108 TaxID=742733 RepID=G5HQK4_9FIRM|nr:J domain-containing protein [Enterocloster citroniae]EHE96330.1 hypothetical protein HMPREF9469_04866 [ [[Clostridium] citroniae WAL-17108]MCC3387120.1 J domain-containing protein [Enterocloster citroniae]
MSTYFNTPKTLEELRKQYKDLLKKYHPDNPNGSEDICKAINVEYETLFKELKDQHNETTKDTTNQTYNNMKWDFAEDEALRDMLSNVIQLVGLNITIVGNWIWIDGNTYPHKATLKEMGFKWAHEKKKWYWHSETFRKKSNKKLSFDTICNYYGSADVRTEQRTMIEA